MALFIPNLKALDLAMEEVENRMRDMQSAASRYETTLSGALGNIASVRVENLPDAPEITIDATPSDFPTLDAPTFEVGVIAPPVLNMQPVAPIETPMPAELPSIDLNLSAPVLPDVSGQFKPIVAPDDLMAGIAAIEVPALEANIQPIAFDTSEIVATTTPMPTEIPNINIDIPAPVLPSTIDAPQAINFTKPDTGLFINLPAAPVFTPEQLTFPDAPPPISVDDIIGALDFSDFDLPDSPIAPIPEALAAPVLNDIALPVAPSIDTAVDIPEAPQLVMPEIDALMELDIPDFEFDEIEPFDKSGMPDVADTKAALDTIQNDIVKDTANYLKEINKEFAEQYQDESNITRSLTTNISEWLQSDKTPWSGLPAAIEAALFNRVVDRESQVTNRAVDEAVNEWASRGFSMPQGMLQKQISGIRDQGALRASDASRESLAQSFPKQIEQLQWLVTQGMAVEQRIYERFKDQQSLSLDAMKFQIDSKWKIYDANVTLFNLQNEAFKMLFDVYKLSIEVAISKISVFKARIDAQVALGQVNLQKIEIFKSKISAVMAQVDIYKASMQAAQVRSDTIKTQFDVFKTQVQAYSEQIGAEKVKIDIFDSQVKAESARLGMFESLSRNYASTIQGLSAKADIKNKSHDMKLEAAKVKLQEFSVLVDSHKAQVSEQVASAQNNTNNFVREVEVFKAIMQHNLGLTDAETKYADLDLRASMAGADIQSKYSDSQVRVALATADLQSKNIDIQSRVALAELDSNIKYADMVSRTNINNAEIAAKYADINLRTKTSKADIDVKVAEANTRIALAGAEMKIKHSDMVARTGIANAEMISRTNIANAEMQSKYADSNSRMAIASAELQGKYADIQARAATTNLDAQVKYADMVNRTNVSNTDSYTRVAEANARINANNADVQAKYADMATRSAIANAETKSRHADMVSRTNIAMADVQARFADMKTRTNIAQSELYMKQYDSNVQQMIEKAKISLEAAKAVGQLSAQLASGAMSAMHVSASISGSGSQSMGYSASESESTSHNYSY